VAHHIAVLLLPSSHPDKHAHCLYSYAMLLSRLRNIINKRNKMSFQSCPLLRSPSRFDYPLRYG
jgi:hypothetical protein